MTLLVAGGAADPNTCRIIAAAAEERVETWPLLVGADAHPTIEWRIGSEALRIDGTAIQPRGVFLRYDVFATLGAPAADQGRAEFRAQTWYGAVAGWLATVPAVRAFNRGAITTNFNKLQVLSLARESGLATPSTLVTNSMTTLGSLKNESWIAKPVMGGQHTLRLADALAGAQTKGGALSAPAIVQPELVGPEMRVYVIGRRQLAFQVDSAALDYRVDPSPRLTFLGEGPRRVRAGLSRLCAKMGLDFGAADFKRDPRTGELLFLEMNTGPMFAAFDACSSGALARAMVRHLASTS